MQVEDKNITTKARTLKDYIPLVITFFVGLIILSIYQNFILYYKGVLDSVLNKSLFIQLLHHLGFASVCSVLLAFLFNLLENKKPSLGFKVTRLLLALFLVIEGILITYFIGNYEPFGASSITENTTYVAFSLIQALLAITLTLVLCHFLYRYTAPLYKVISRMYPFTIILFSLFLATLYSERKPINENKTQYLLEDLYTQVFEEDKYEGKEEFPLVKPYKRDTNLTSLLNLKVEKPHIKIIIVEGLGKKFVDSKNGYADLMPALNKLMSTALYWPNYLSNTGEDAAAMPLIIGSLPYGETGFTQLESFTHRHTLFSIMKDNGYETSFNFGGNSALHSYDKFLVQEGVDRILDKTIFGKAYSLQDEDAAGISLGYPDMALFQRYQEEQMATSNAPKLDVFLTLSTKNPYAIPNEETYIKNVENYLAGSSLNDKSKRLIEHNLKLFASYSYVDNAIDLFFEEEKKSKEYNNTIYLITGSHLNRNLPSENPLERFQVPLIIYSPLVKEAKILDEMVSHADIAPSLISLLDNTYSLQVPNTVAWLGDNAIFTQDKKNIKEIPLYRGAHNIQDYIYNNYFLTDGDVTKLNSDLSWSESEVSEKNIDLILRKFKYSKSVNKYVTQQDKLIPASASLISNSKRVFTKTEMIWLQSVFNGKDFDNAYGTARKLAFKKDWDRSLLLCEYILSQIPRHADTEILKGRVYSWRKEYSESISTLKEVIRKYPDYVDGYCALLDTYYWSNPNQDISLLLYQIERQNIDDALLNKKIERASTSRNTSINSLVKLEIE